MRQLTWSFILVCCIVFGLIEAISTEQCAATIGQLFFVSLTGLAILLLDKSKEKYVQALVVTSFIVQAVFLTIIDIYDPHEGIELAKTASVSGALFSESDENRLSPEMHLVRPTQWAVLLMYCFTQGLTFK